MLTLVSRVKATFSGYPRTSKFIGKVYHFFNYYRISQSQLRMLKRQLRLQRYFETIIGLELDYLRKHCRELEGRCQEKGNNFADGRFFLSLTEDSYKGLKGSDAGIPTYTKNYKTKNRWAGLSADQALALEVQCLKKLESSLDLSESEHYPFPKLVGVYPERLSVEMTICGKSLDQLEAVDQMIVVPGHQQQLENIVSYLSQSDVIHLDLRPDGKNICVDEHGNLSLIDFDIASISETRPISFQIARRLHLALRYPGGYEQWAMSRLNRALYRYKGKLQLR